MAMSLENIQALREPRTSAIARLKGYIMYSAKLMRNRLQEYLTYDSFVFQRLAVLLALMLAGFFWLLGRRANAYRILTAIHRSNRSRSTDALVESVLRPSNHRAAGPFGALCRQHIDQAASRQSIARFVADPCRMLGSRLLVLKSAKADEKGVLVIDYSFAFPLFLKLYDITKISSKYHIVLEPSWAGYCDLDILCYSQLDFPVFVQTGEPRDIQFLAQIRSNLIPVPIAANWWVDHRVMRPLPDVKKEVDVIMVAGWASYKRHPQFFRALARLRAVNRTLRVALVGYPSDCTAQDIRMQAAYYGVDDQLEILEGLTPEQVNYQLNRAKVNLLWSRKEGFNRAIIEGMFAGVPCIMRTGFNFGYRYPYINAETGVFATEAELPRKLLWSVANYRRFSPRPWVMSHMSCHEATGLLSEAIRTRAVSSGEAWTAGLTVKVSHLNTMQYWDPQQRQEFEPDFAFLRSALRA